MWFLVCGGWRRSHIDKLFSLEYSVALTSLFYMKVHVTERLSRNLPIYNEKREAQAPPLSQIWNF